MSDEAVISVVATCVLFGAPMLWLIVDSLAKNWRKARVAEQQTILKREMIDRGFLGRGDRPGAGGRRHARRDAQARPLRPVTGIRAAGRARNGWSVVASFPG